MPLRRANVDASAASYPNWVGFVFVFNLIVGTGALTLPGAFAKAGWLLSLVIIILLAIISYMTVTFVIEAMACACAIKNWQNLQNLRLSRNASEDEAGDEDQPLLQSSAPDQAERNGELERLPLTLQSSEFLYYQLNYKFELGELATLFFNDIGRILFYLCFIIYLYGDLSIYSAAVARSLRDVVCDRANITDAAQSNLINWLADANINNNTSRACWEQHTISRLSMYRVFLISFTSIFGPFAAFSLQKTKYLQIITAVLRWMAFTLMICLALKLLISRGPKGHPVSINVYGVPSLFGACIYSFMCHHSLPSLLAPLQNKLKASKILSYDYAVILLFYVVLAMTGIFAFEHIEDLYTLNFLPSHNDHTDFFSEFLVVIDYFLALFPIFTLSTSFPIIAITLRNNLQTLFLDMSRYESYNFFLRRILFPLCVVFPPFCITYFTESLANLVAFTGSYAGTGIQYIIPVCLVYFSRRICAELLGSGISNPFQSPFKSKYWLAFVLIWSVASVFLVTINLFS